MAHIVPSDITQMALSGAHRGEMATLDTLKRALPPSLTVFHNIHWSRARDDVAAFGEIDFIVVDGTGRCLVIEQKDGALEEGAGGLVKRYGDRPKDVGAQLHRNLDALRDKFRRMHGDRLDVDYLLYCPDHHVARLSSVGLDAARIVDAGERDRLAERVRSLLDPAAQPTPAAKRVDRFLRNSFDLVPDVHAHARAGEQAFTRLSGGLSEIVDNIEMSPLRLRIGGSPGCGKTVIAVRSFERAVAAGRRPLLVCFNRALKESIAAAVPKGGLVQTWYGLCDTFLTARGHELDYDRVRTDPGFWSELRERIVCETIPDKWMYDTLIADEGQDFEPEWLETLELFLRDGHDTLWLEDRDQNIRSAEAMPLDGFVGYRSRANHRSPASIARFMSRSLPFEFQPMNPLPGLGVAVSPYDEPEDQTQVVAGIVDDLLARGFEPSQIVLLTLRGIDSSALGATTQVGPHSLSRFTGDYDRQGNQVMTEGRFRMDSIGRFKGQQAPAVVLLDVDMPPGKEADWHRRLYVGASRATVRLEIVARRGNPLTERLQDAAMP